VGGAIFLVPAGRRPCLGRTSLCGAQSRARWDGAGSRALAVVQRPRAHPRRRSRRFSRHGRVAWHIWARRL